MSTPVTSDYLTRRRLADELELLCDATWDEIRDGLERRYLEGGITSRRYVELNGDVEEHYRNVHLGESA